MVTMVRMDHNDSLIINRLGGNSVVAKIFDISSQAVSKWRKTGIPKPSRMYLQAIYPAAFEADGSVQATATVNPENSPNLQGEAG